VDWVAEVVTADASRRKTVPASTVVPPAIVVPRNFRRVITCTIPAPLTTSMATVIEHAAAFALLCGYYELKRLDPAGAIITEIVGASAVGSHTNSRASSGDHVEGRLRFESSSGQESL